MGLLFYSFIIIHGGGGCEDFSNFRFSFPDVHRSLQKTPTINNKDKAHNSHSTHSHIEHDLQVQSKAKLLQFGVLAFKIEVKERERERGRKSQKETERPQNQNKMEENAAATPTSASTSTFERDDAWKELMGTDIMMKVRSHKQ